MGIQLEHVSHTYRNAANMKSYIGLKDVDLSLEEGRFIAVLGVSGSGKSTLMQHMNGILLPTEGQIRIMDFHYRSGSGEKPAQFQELRKRVGLLFQFPEQQLFEETVGKDIAFGPRNFGATEAEAEAAAKAVVERLGLDAGILQRSPFELSSGQLRKVAIATVMVMNPDIYVLDEPTASLDQASRVEVLQLFRALCVNEGKTIIVVSHRLDEVLPFADEFVILNEGRMTFHGSSDALRNNLNVITDAGMIVPHSLRFLQEFSSHFQVDIPVGQQRIQDIADYVSRVLGGAIDAK